MDLYCPRGWAYAENCRFSCHSKEAIATPQERRECDLVIIVPSPGAGALGEGTMS